MKAFLMAFRFLTIIPLGKGLEFKPELIGAAGKFYPLVGLVMGGSFWCFYNGARLLFPPLVTTGLLLLFWVLLTGALHLDGLADCLDSLYGGRDPESRLRIMKDVHLGTMGTVGLILILGLKFLALGVILPFKNSVWWLILIPALSRWTPIFLSCFHPYARPGGGLGAALVQGTGKKELFWASLFAWVPVVLLERFLGVGVILVVLVWVFFCGRYFFKKIGGVTGDVMGAVIESSELLAMLVIIGAVPYV
jgi:adenosylcobinamide-GDP ribazoletransferase